MNKVTSITIFRTAEGMRLSITYSEIDVTGKIVSENNRINRIIVDETALQTAEAMQGFAQEIIDTEGGEA